MDAYLSLLREVVERGKRKPTRAVLRSTGEKVDALSLFGLQNRYDLADGFPLATTKRVHFKSVMVELFWFLTGRSNTAYLKNRGVTIWDEWQDENGDLGPVYGVQWRAWEGADGRRVDQVANLVEGIKAVKEDPTASVGRRLILSAWNVADLPQMALPPCHCFTQFMVDGGRLHCQLYQRSADMFLGVPFNIASYSLLTHLLAHVTGLRPGEFIHTFGDAHVYVNHLDAVREQLGRAPRPLPTLELVDAPKHIDAINETHVRLVGYNPWPGLKGEVAV